MFFRKKDIIEDSDWRDLNTLPQEIISKKELDILQKETIDEIARLEKDTIRESEQKETAKPQTLFYYHKFIDSKFNKNDSTLNRYYAQKQNMVDKKYAQGLGDIRSEFTGYKELIEEIHEVDTRLREKTNKLDPSSKVDVNDFGTYDDSGYLQEIINQLPESIEWVDGGDK